jgi:hypothetical protein
MASADLMLLSIRCGTLNQYLRHSQFQPL